MDSVPDYHLSAAVSTSDGAHIYPGDHILVRLPASIDLENNTDIGSASSLPPTSSGRSPGHFAFVRSVSIHADRSYELEVYPQLSFSRSGGAVNGYNSLATDTMRAALIPLPPLSSHCPTPESFGTALTVGGWSNDRDAWLSVKPIRLILPSGRPFKRMIPPVALSPLELAQIERYRATLLVAVGPSGGTSGGTGSGGGGSGPGQGSKLASHFKGRNWGTLRGFGKKRNGVEQQEAFQTSHPSDDLPVLEGINEDAEVIYPTYKDEITMLASYGEDTGMWKEELAKILRAEREEQEKVTTERMARLSDWLHIQ